MVTRPELLDAGMSAGQANAYLEHEAESLRLAGHIRTSGLVGVNAVLWALYQRCRELTPDFALTFSDSTLDQEDGGVTVRWSATMPGGRHEGASIWAAAWPTNEALTIALAQVLRDAHAAIFSAHHPEVRRHLPGAALVTVRLR